MNACRRIEKIKISRIIIQRIGTRESSRLEKLLALSITIGQCGLLVGYDSSSLV